MIKKNITSLLSVLFLFAGNLIIFAQIVDEWEETETPDPPGPETIGAPASPIDMYVYVLVIIAFLLIIYSKKIKQKKVA